MKRPSKRSRLLKSGVKAYFYYWKGEAAVSHGFTKRLYGDNYEKALKYYYSLK